MYDVALQIESEFNGEIKSIVPAEHKKHRHKWVGCFFFSLYPFSTHKRESKYPIGINMRKQLANKFDTIPGYSRRVRVAGELVMLGELIWLDFLRTCGGCGKRWGGGRRRSSPFFTIITQSFFKLNKSTAAPNHPRLFKHFCSSRSCKLSSKSSPKLSSFLLQQAHKISFEMTKNFRLKTPTSHHQSTFTRHTRVSQPVLRHKVESIKRDSKKKWWSVSTKIWH